MKKYIPIVAFSLILTGAGLKPIYTDINNHWAEKYIEQMSDEKLLVGYTDGSFKPDNNILNVETYSVINRLFKFNSYDSDKLATTNELSKEWYYNDLLAAESGGYININNNFKVEPITRLEVCKILGSLYDLSYEGQMSFNDISHLSSQEINTINALAKDGIINGFWDGTFKPSEHITRAQLTKILVLSKDKYGTELFKFDNVKRKSVIDSLEKITSVHTQNLNHADVEKLNYILDNLTSGNYISNSEMDTWIEFLNKITSTSSTKYEGFYSELNQTNPIPISQPSTNNLNLNIKVTDTSGNPIAATIKLNNNIFNGSRISQGKYLLKIESPGKKPYESFLEITSDQELTIQLEDSKQSYLKLILNSPTLNSPSGYEFKAGSRVTVNINIPHGMEIDYLLVNGVKKNVLNDEFTFIINENTQIDVSFKPEEIL